MIDWNDEEVIEDWENAEQEERYLVKFIRKYLLSEYDRNWLHKNDLSIEDVLSGRYGDVGHEVQAMFVNWNNKMGEPHFGDYDIVFEPAWEEPWERGLFMFHWGHADYYSYGGKLVSTLGPDGVTNYEFTIPDILKNRDSWEDGLIVGIRAYLRSQAELLELEDV